ncbi:DUF3987 domain-containing protein [Desulfobacter sp.]|uniref:DUF3987 domain-containing protein n=1 Tax=Desulfobacter sp. TaxID=2294 RepID=UPI00257AC229|nr:DUF3987 domain-containing protein [Desulfobacter sp.]
MDIIDFHGWLTGKTIPDLMREYLPDDAGQNEDTRQPTPHDLFSKRGLTGEVIRILTEARGLKVTAHAGKQCVAVPYVSLQGEIKATQFLTIDQRPFPFTEKNKPANKVFGRGDKPGDDCFFFAGPGPDQAKEFIFCESVINAMTAFQWFPDACCIALGGSTYTKKAEALKPYINVTKTVRVAQDNDPAGDKMLQAIKKILNGQDVYYFAWKPNDKPGTDINDLVQVGRTETPGRTPWVTDAPPQSPWGYAREKFPKTQFPWDVLPIKVSGSLKQLARSCAVSPTHLPGIAFGILAAVLGRHVEVRVKSSWAEPLIFWTLALLPSGQGKSPAQNALSAPIYIEQERLDTAHKKAMETWKALPPEEQSQNPKPESLGGIFTTDMTIEGLRHDQRACGGMLISNDEASSFFEGQNQYKKSGKGTDRESWLKLYDGNPARIVRSSGAVFLKGARASIVGGTQPDVFWRIFKSDSKGDVFLVDGTLFRFMKTWEGEKFFPMTTESWDESNRETWDNIIKNALSFCRAHTSITDDGENQVDTHSLWFTEETMNLFIDWANDVKGMIPKFPVQVRGYIPKLVGWAVRLTGILKCMNAFITDTKVRKVIEPEDLQRGIRLAEFYMGHNIDVLNFIVNSDAPVKEVFTEQEAHLALTLQGLKNQVDNGRLAIPFILKKYNETASSDLKFQGKNSNPFRNFLESCGLNVPEKKSTANGYKNYKCLLWDKQADIYLENFSTNATNPTTLDGQGCGVVENVKQNSTNSTAEAPLNTGFVEKVEKVEDFSGIDSDEVTI